MSITQQTLADRISQLDAHRHPRAPLSDGSLGYQLEAKTVIEVVMGSDENDASAPRETIELLTTECEVSFPDPTMRADGAMQFDLEIRRLVSVGRSSVLFGKDVPIRLLVGRGLDSMMRPTFGRLIVPEGVRFGEIPVISTQLVNLLVETPMGYLHNREAAVMQARVTHLPPLHQAYHQKGNVPLFLEGNEYTPVAHKLRASSTAMALMPVGQEGTCASPTSISEFDLILSGEGR